MANQELISRKIQSRAHSESSGSTSQSAPASQVKKGKLPKAASTAQSPAAKHKKQGSKDDASSELTKSGPGFAAAAAAAVVATSGRDKDSRTWKGKMAKRFKRSASSSASTLADGGDVIDSNVSFGVPLEDCPPSTFSEVRTPNFPVTNSLESHV